MELPSLTDPWNPYLASVTRRFDREVGIQLGEPGWEIPQDLQTLPFWQASRQDHLEDRLSIPFHQVRTPKARENCLDLGCGVSFLIYPWNQWQAHFYGHELSPRITKLIQSRAPQLNSKLFKSIHQGAAHHLDTYPEAHFDLVIATGFLYYYPPEYLEAIWQGLPRLLKPKAQILLEVVRPDSPWAEEWGLIELSKGVEPLFTPLERWEQLITGLRGKVLRQEEGELFTTLLIALP